MVRIPTLGCKYHAGNLVGDKRQLGRQSNRPVESEMESFTRTNGTVMKAEIQ